MSPDEPLGLVVIALAFLGGGLVKGFAGLGLPMVTVALLSFVFGLPTAMALMLVPGLLTNLWQASSGGAFREAVAGTWHFLAACLSCVWLGTAILVASDPDRIVAALGFVLLGYALAAIVGYRLAVPERHRGWSGWMVGAVNGLSAGMTGVTSVPSVLWLNGIGLSRAALVQAMGLLFGASYVVLSAAFWAKGLLDTSLATLSALAFLPAWLGMVAGRAAQQRLSNERFRWAFDRVLAAVGLYLVVRALS